jgi:hypothetical protein
VSALAGGSEAGREGSRNAAPGPAPAPADSRYRQLAWLVMGTGFVIFCLLCAGFVAGSAYYSQHASIVPQTAATVELAHGTKLEVQHAGQKAWNLVSKATELSEGDSVRTGQDTDALLTLFDQSTVQLYYSSTVTLKRIRSSQFLNQFKEMRLVQSSGSIKVAAAALGPYNTMELQVTNPDGKVTVGVPENSVAVITLDTPAVDNAYMTVATRTGTSWVRTTGPRRIIPIGEMCRVQPDYTVTDPGQEEIELVDNSEFVKPADNPNTEIAAGWRLSPLNPAEEQITATRSTETFFGKTVYTANFLRAAQSTELATVRIRQDMDIPVNFYQQLQVKAAVKLVEPPYIGPGLYPLTLRVTYEDLDGVTRLWERNFYAGPLPYQPEGGTIELDAGTWKELPQELPPDGGDAAASWDLMTQSPAPARIKAVEVIVTGYSFNASVSGISLTAR